MKKTINFPDESKYVGEVKNGKPNGKGTLTYPDKGGKYDGDWKNGKYHGDGKLTYHDGGIYIGQFKNGKCDGYGDFKIRGGQKYSGNWKNGKYHGQGTLIWTNWDETSHKITKEKYIGEFKDGEIYTEKRLNWELSEKDNEEDYKFKVISEFDYESVKSKFNFNKFLNLLKDEDDIFSLILKSCDADKDSLILEFMNPNDDINPDMNQYVDDIMYNKFLPKINSNFSYIPASCYYTYSDTLGESWFSKLDILQIKKHNKIYIVNSGWVRNNYFYSRVIKSLDIKVSKNILMDELIKGMKEHFFMPGVVGLSGGFKWKLNNIFKNIIPHTDSITHFDQSRMEDNCFIFLTNNAENYKYCRPVLDNHHYNVESGGFDVWSEPEISDSIEEQKVNKKFRKIIKTKFSNHFHFNCKLNKWEESDIFSSRK